MKVIRKSVVLLHVMAFACIISCSTSRKISQEPIIMPGIDFSFVGEEVPDTVFVTITPIPTDTTMSVKEFIEAKDTGKRIAIPVTDKKAHIAPDSVPSIYNISLDYYAFPSVWLRNTEHADIKISNLSNLKYEIDGLPYNSPIPHSETFYDLRHKVWILTRKDFSKEEFESNIEKLSSLLDTIMSEVNPETATRVMCMLDYDIVASMFHKLPVGSENTLWYTYACALRNNGNREAAQQEKMETGLSTSASVEFTLNSLDGVSFDISTLRGKWVVIDFWVSWCKPCRRGFESMKKLYSEISDRMEIVAIACGDQTETWERLVEELQLPWTNLLAPSPESNGGTVGGYPVSAYPTKIVIDPEGRMRDYMVGEDDEFYTRLKNMIITP